MFDKKGLRKPQKPGKKSRRFRDWNRAQMKETDRKSGERNEIRRRPLKFRDEDEMDWRDLLMEEGDDILNGP